MPALQAKPLRVAHIITTLQTGGAEAMLAKLVTACRTKDCESLVVCLGPDGPMGERVRAAGISTVVLDLGLSWSAVQRLFKATMVLRRWRPDLLQGWMYHGNFFASLMQVWLMFSPRLLWNIRCTIDRMADYPRMTQLIIRLGALLSRCPQVVVFNSQSAVEQHSKVGMRPRRLLVLPNGFDTSRFRPDPVVRGQVRERLGIRQGELLVGMIARYHPMKDYSNFIAAARELIARSEDICILLAGPQVDESNPELTRMLVDAGIASRVVLLGELNDPTAVLPALDIFCLSSAWGEGFPNVLGEAMACGVPCVATNVGDSEFIISETGYVVEPRDHMALSAALLRMAQLPVPARLRLGEQARKRIESHFEIEEILDRYLLIWR